MSKQIKNVKFVRYTYGFKVFCAFYATFVFLLVVPPLTFLSSDSFEVRTSATGQLAISAFIVLVTLTAIIGFIKQRTGQVLVIFEDRVEMRTNFITEQIRRIESAKIETVDVRDALMGQRRYGSIVVTGTGGSKIVASPVPDQHKLAEMIRGVANASGAKKSGSAKPEPVEATRASDFTEQLANLQKLRDSGALTEEEFNIAKGRVLGI